MKDNNQTGKRPSDRNSFELRSKYIYIQYHRHAGEKGFYM